MYSQIASNKRKTSILILLFITIVALLGYFLGVISGYGYWGLIFAAIYSGVATLISYYNSDKIALWSTGAKAIKKEDNPYVYRMVENLCITSGQPTPAVYLIDDPAPNAFATGRDPEHASIALTTGIIKALENEELEGVIAHELSHIKNYDIRIMTIVIGLIGIITILANIFLHNMFWRNSDNDRNNNPIFLIIGIVLAILSPLIAQIIQLAISRKREFLADASGALLTRYPEGLASALNKISRYNAPLQKVSTATAHLFITNPLGGKFSVSNLFSTHPPIEERINALMEMGR